MSSIQDQIREAAPQNEQLLSNLRKTESAPAQLAQQNAYLKDLEAQSKVTEKEVSSLKAKTTSELKDHKKYSESTFRRFAHKATGRKERFEEKASKEEREYFDSTLR